MDLILCPRVGRIGPPVALPSSLPRQASPCAYTTLLSVVASDSTRQPGQYISERYLIRRSLGDGRDGEVYLVGDEYLGQDVVLKILKPKSGQSATWNEAQLLVQLGSEFLVPVHNADILYPSDLRYLTTTFMDGGDLGSRAAPCGLSVAEARKYAIEVSHGLHRVHLDGLLHRDVKPNNVFLSRSGGAKLGDLGSAHQMDDDGTAPPDGTFVTVAPEVLGRDGRCSVATDVYSLGATICFFLTGQYPVSNRGDIREVRDRVIRGEARSVRDLGPHISQGVGQIVERCISRDPSRRPASAHEVANMLASASVHRRDWRAIADHSEHLRCFEGGPLGRKPGIRICALPTTGARCDLEVRNATGRRIRRYEQQNLLRTALNVRLRELAQKL